MNRNKPGERFLFACLLVALIVGIVATKLWVMDVEQRLADSLDIQWKFAHTNEAQTDVLYNHENRLRRVERTAWAVWDHHAPCDGWLTQQEIARGRDDE